MKSKAKALSKLSKQEKSDYSAKEGSGEWRGKMKGESKRLGESMKCANCGSMKHMTKDCIEK